METYHKITWGQINLKIILVIEIWSLIVFSFFFKFFTMFLCEHLERNFDSNNEVHLISPGRIQSRVTLNRAEINVIKTRSIHAARCWQCTRLLLFQFTSLDCHVLKSYIVLNLFRVFIFLKCPSLLRFTALLLTAKGKKPYFALLSDGKLVSLSPRTSGRR